MAGRITAWRLRPWASAPADYSAVVIPLEQAHLHSHSARCGRAEYEEVPGADPEEDGGGGGKDDDGEEGEGEARGMLEMSAAEYSIAGLRKEVRRRDGSGRGRGVYESELFYVVVMSGR